MSASLPIATVRTEPTSPAKDTPAGGGSSFTVVLARSGLELVVAHGASILDAVLDAGVNAAHSCMEGVCGTCETPVLEGVPEHRDLVLSNDERASNRRAVAG